jgi:hypothetical protein
MGPEEPDAEELEPPRAQALPASEVMGLLADRTESDEEAADTPSAPPARDETP